LLALPTLAQSAQLPAPSPAEKELAARASHVDEVTLDKNMLGFAAQFMDGKDKDAASIQRLIAGLDGIYVRDYEFDKEGQFSAEQVDQLRKYFETSQWSSLVRDRDRKTGESSDVMVKLVNGKSEGLFILDVEPKEISIVMILGSIRMEDLVMLSGVAGLGSLEQLAPQAPSPPPVPKGGHGPKRDLGPKGELGPQEELGPQGALGSQNAQVAQGAPPPPPPPAGTDRSAGAAGWGAEYAGTAGFEGGKQNQRTPLPRCKGQSPCFP
jgi:hypothetical protein